MFGSIGGPSGCTGNDGAGSGLVAGGGVPLSKWNGMLSAPPFSYCIALLWISGGTGDGVAGFASVTGDDLGTARAAAAMAIFAGGKSRSRFQTLAV